MNHRLYRSDVNFREEQTDGCPPLSVNFVIDDAEDCTPNFSASPEDMGYYLPPSGVPVMCATGGSLSRKPLYM